MKGFFIMMYSQNGEYIMPILDDNENVLIFGKYEDAKYEAETHDFCKAFGYDIYEVGMGI